MDTRVYLNEIQQTWVNFPKVFRENEDFLLAYAEQSVRKMKGDPDDIEYMRDLIIKNLRLENDILNIAF